MSSEPDLLSGWFALVLKGRKQISHWPLRPMASALRYGRDITDVSGVFTGE